MTTKLDIRDHVPMPASRSGRTGGGHTFLSTLAEIGFDQIKVNQNVQFSPDLLKELGWDEPKKKRDRIKSMLYQYAKKKRWVLAVRTNESDIGFGVWRLR